MSIFSNVTKYFKKVEKKSANDGGWTTIGYGCSLVYPTGSTRPIDLIAANKDFVYACNQKISTYLSSVPIHLYSSVNNSKNLLVDFKKVRKHQVKHLKSVGLSSVIKKALESDIVEIENHPALAIMKTPSPSMSWASWIAFVQCYLSITGNALIEIVREGNNIVELKPLLWEAVDPVMDYSTGRITSYRYTPQYGSPKTLTPEQVIHFTNLQPGSTVIGQGALEKCIASANLYSYYDAYAMSLARNAGTPSAHIDVKANVVSKEELEKIKRDYIMQYGGINNGRPMVTFGQENTSVKVTPLGFPPKDMEYQSGRNWAKKTICACFGVPEDLVDVSDSNRASSTTAINSFINLTIFPLLNKVLEEINTRVIAEYDDKLFLSFDPLEILEKDPIQQATVINSYVASGILSKEEARMILNYEEEQ